MDVDLRSSWGRKGSAASGTATLVNRATTPSSTRTNSPTPSGNAWNTKADERVAHDALTHLLFTLTVCCCADTRLIGRANRFYCILGVALRSAASSLHLISNNPKMNLHWFFLMFFLIHCPIQLLLQRRISSFYQKKSHPSPPQM